MARGTAGSGALTGARIGDYVLAAEIASGGMGVVYLARRADSPRGEAYALKIVHDDLVRRFPEVADRLHREAGLAARFCDPGAVRVVEVGEHDDRPYAVMPYVEGGTLADLGAAGRASPGVVASVMVDALRGLDAAHAAEDERGGPLGLVHRDVCPENVLVGGDGRARITDFGIAIAADADEAARGSARGKWPFMAPEQIRGERVDRRADVFSAGVTLHHALTGRDLFRGPSPAATMQNVLHMPVPPPSEAAPGVPPALDGVCARSLAREREARFSTAGEMADAIAEAAAAAGIAASPAEVAEAVWAAVGDRLRARRDALAQAERTEARLAAGSGQYPQARPPAGVAERPAARGEASRQTAWVRLWRALRAHFNPRTEADARGAPPGGKRRRGGPSPRDEERRRGRR